MNNSIPFAVIIPGKLPISDFQCTNNLFHIDLPAASQIQYITIVLTSPLPQDAALSLHYSLPPYTGMVYMGAVSNSKPSDTFSTGWGINSQVIDFEATNPSQFLKLCVRIDPLSNLVQIEKNMGEDRRKTYARCVAQNLYNFMSSFDNNYDKINKFNCSQYLIVPQDFLEKWFKKFEEKFRRDPNFIFKTTNQ